MWINKKTDELIEWLECCETILEGKLKVHPAKRFLRITLNGIPYANIDKVTGDVFKPNNSNGEIRGNILNPTDNPLDYMCATGLKPRPPGKPIGYKHKCIHPRRKKTVYQFIPNRPRKPRAKKLKQIKRYRYVYVMRPIIEAESFVSRLKVRYFNPKNFLD